MNEDLGNLIELNPPWKQAVINFLASGFGEGTVIPKEWLYKNFHLQQPTDKTSWKQAQKTELLFLSYFKQFEKALLIDHQIHLYNKFAVGYEVVKVQEQTGRADEEGDREIQRSLGKRGQRLIHVDLKRLTDRERQQNADSLAKLAQLSGMVKRLKQEPGAKDLPEIAEN